jgi:hypothetical protein
MPMEARFQVYVKAFKSGETTPIYGKIERCRWCTTPVVEGLQSVCELRVRRQ